MVWIFCLYFLFHRGITSTSINHCSMRQRHWKSWEWKLTKVSGDSLKLAQGCASICWQERLIIWSELNQKRGNVKVCWSGLPELVPGGLYIFMHSVHNLNQLFNLFPKHFSDSQVKKILWRKAFASVICLERSSFKYCSWSFLLHSLTS